MVVENFEQPPVDPAGIVAAWGKWSDGEEMPGRTMADLKIAGLPVALEVMAGDNDLAASVLESWVTWEKAKATPQIALDAMTDAGVGTIIEAFAAA